MDIEEKQIKDYIDNFYTIDQIKILTKKCLTNTFDDADINNIEYTNICNKILSLLDGKLKDKYRIEIEDHCRILIKKLFETYVDKDTLVITSSHDHQTVTDLVGDNKHIVNAFEAINEPDKAVEKIITSFKKSKCLKIFFIMVATAPQIAITIPQEFFNKVKQSFINNKIPHIMILDDCQSIFIIDKNYEIFDGFLATSHVLSPLLSRLGLLFTKLPQKIGYRNKQTLNDFYSKLEVIKSTANKASKFNELLYNYFKPTLSKTGFDVFESESPHQFSIHLPDVINNLYNNRFLSYGIIFNPVNARNNFLRLRYHEIVIQDSNEFIKVLPEIKKVLNKLSRFRENSDIKPNYDMDDKDRLITYDVMHLNKVIRSLLTIDQMHLLEQQFFGMTLSRTR